MGEAGEEVGSLRPSGLLAKARLEVAKFGYAPAGRTFCALLCSALYEVPGQIVGGPS